MPTTGSGSRCLPGLRSVGFEASQAGGSALPNSRPSSPARTWAARKARSPVAQIARDFGVSESCLHRWMQQADIEDGVRPGATQAEAVEATYWNVANWTLPERLGAGTAAGDPWRMWRRRQLRSGQCHQPPGQQPDLHDRQRRRQ